MWVFIDGPALIVKSPMCVSCSLAGLCARRPGGADEGIISAVRRTPEEMWAQPERLRSPMVMDCVEDYLVKVLPLELIRHYE